MKRHPRRIRGQSTIEYLLMVGIGAILAIEVTRFFNGVFQDGLQGLERNVQNEMASGQKFGRF